MQLLFPRIKEIIDNYYTEQDYPALYSQVYRWTETKPLADISVLDATPVFRNTMTKYMALLAAGAKLSVGISSVMPYDSKIIAFLREIGVNVVTPDTKENFDIILDCAGAFSRVPAKIGYSELTRSGVGYYTHCAKPVFMADSGAIKKIETMLGTGESLFRSLSGLGYSNWNNKKIVVFGSGKVGSGIIMYGSVYGAAVTVVSDPKTVTANIASKCQYILNYRDDVAVCKAVLDANLIVMATGCKNAITNVHVAHAITRSDALLANMGVEDEFGEMIPAERVLNSKKPLNFTLEEPTHLKYIEATMALHNIGAIYLLNNPYTASIIVPSPQMEQEILEITRSKGVIAQELNLFL
ncbi:MAG: hypothetical protein RR735_07025 [Bacteroidales bacterium]